MYNFIKYVSLNEGKSPQTLHQSVLGYKRDALDPVFSEDAIDLHYGKLYKGYVDRFNKGEGDADFNESGAFLHNLYFEQFQEPENNKPSGKILEFIEKHFKTFEDFKDKFESQAMKIQGSGWCYLARNGEIKTIKNHEIKMDIVLLVDMWEHVWLLDYGSDKKKYLKNQWKVFNWDKIESRVGPQS
jgi:Fe-Mn family superoxide dismutase